MKHLAEFDANPAEYYVRFHFMLLLNSSLPRFQKKLYDNMVRVTAADFPTLLYPSDGYDPDDPESGLFWNLILVRVSYSFNTSEGHPYYTAY